MPLFDEDTQIAILQKQFGAVNYTPTSSYKIGLVTVVPDDDDGEGLVEPEDFAYSRLTILNNTDEFGLSENGTEVVNLKEWSFAQATVDWGSIFGLALFNSADEYQGYLPFDTPKYIATNQGFKIPAGKFIVASDDTPLSVTIEETLVPTILTSPGGLRYIQSVDDTGAAVYTSTDFFGPPAPPTSLSNDSGYLTWAVSTSNGGSPIVSQTLWVADANESLVDFIILDAEVEGYNTGGVPGQYFITADNPVGSSAPSNVVTVS